MVTSKMLDLILALIQDVNKVVAEELKELPTVSPKKEQPKWFPFYELEEVVVLK